MLESNLKVTRGIDENFSANQLSYISSYPTEFTEQYNPYSLGFYYGEGLKYTLSTGFYNFILTSGMVPMRISDFDSTCFSYLYCLGLSFWFCRSEVALINTEFSIST